MSMRGVERFYYTVFLLLSGVKNFQCSVDVCICGLREQQGTAVRHVGELDFSTTSSNSPTLAMLCLLFLQYIIDMLVTGSSVYGLREHINPPPFFSQRNCKSILRIRLYFKGKNYRLFRVSLFH